ncbi:TPA: CpXC domain-containing protein [Streptococcus suis]|nr:CpXC domain-containing protein [Streptococcus suis]
MTNIQFTSITCQCCGVESTFEKVDRIDANKTPMFIDSIIDWELFKFNCKECSHQVMIEYPTIYHDKENKIIIQFSPLNDNAVLTSQIASLLLEGLDINNYQIRVVSELEDFVEKVQIFSQGFDDRAIELMKYLKSPTEVEDIQFAYEHMVFTKVGKNNYQFMFIHNQDIVASLDFDEELYEECYSEICDCTTNTFYINETWAEEFARHGKKMK